jgi:hypothetical protein
MYLCYSRNAECRMQIIPLSLLVSFRVLLFINLILGQEKINERQRKSIIHRFFCEESNRDREDGVGRRVK